MRILEFSTSGGVGRTYMGPVTNDILQLATHCQQQGADVTVVDAAGGASISEDSRPRFPATVDLVEIDSSRIAPATGLAHRLGVDPVAQHIMQSVSDEFLQQFDVIHTHKPVVSTALSTRHPCVVYTSHTPNTWVEVSVQDSLKTRTFIRLQEFMGLHDFAAIKLARATIGLGNHLKHALGVKRPGIARRATITAIPNGTNVEDWPVITQDEARHHLNLSADVCRLITVGRLHPTKGIPTLLNALNEPVMQGRKLVVDIIGHGRAEDFAGICRNPSIQVNFHGFVSNREPRFHHLLAAADLMIVPSLFDNQPNVILEALAMSTPVVGSRVGAIPDRVSPTVGSLFPRGDSAELARQVAALLDDQQGMQARRLACRDYVAGKFSWRASAKSHLDFFDGLLADPR